MKLKKLFLLLVQNKKFVKSNFFFLITIAKFERIEIDLEVNDVMELRVQMICLQLL